jgi:hypothetical protein
MSISVSPYNPVQQAGVRAKNPPDLIIASRNPTTSDFGYFIGQLWVNMGPSGSYWGMVGRNYTGPGTGIGYWINFAGAAGAVSSVVGIPGQITATPTTGAVILTLSSPLTIPGATTISTGNLTLNAGNLILSGTASKVLINASVPTTSSVGFFTLAGTASFTLTSSAITANSIILYSLKTLGTVAASAITYTTIAGSATITPFATNDTSTYGYQIIN